MSAFHPVQVRETLEAWFLNAPLMLLPILNHEWGQRTMMCTVVSLVCHADSSTMPGWTEWVEKGDRFPYVKMLLISVPKSN